MILKKLSKSLDKIFSKNLALDWDNVGLQIGNVNRNIGKILITLDINNNVINEAINLKADLIVSHHPLIFNPIGNIVSGDKLCNPILNLIENKIAVYIAHTNYDIMSGGLSDYIAKRLNLINLNIIEPQYEQWYKFVVFVPKEAEEKIRKVICQQGGGKWRNYSCCTFNIEGRGTFIPLEGAKPYTGKIGNINYVDEVRVECIVNESILNRLVRSVVAAHPYEEVAYDVYKIENKFQDAGVGRYGELKLEEYFVDFLELIKDKLKVRNFRWLSRCDADLKGKKIKKVGVVCGSANSLTPTLAMLDCDLLILGEISYHNALNIIDSGKIIIEIGHGCSEKWAIDDMYNKLKEFFAVQKVEIDVIKSKAGYTSWRYYVD